MCASQCVFDFEAGKREQGIVFIYAYRFQGRVIYVGQAVDVAKRRAAHERGDQIIDRFIRKHPREVSFEVLERVSDAPGGPVVNARELELIEQFETWIDLGSGFNVRVKESWQQKFRQHFAISNCTVDFLGGDGPFASVRECRRYHVKGEHHNWYRHIVYKLFSDKEEANKDLALECQPLGCRSTETGVACDRSNHYILHFYKEKGQWKRRIIPFDDHHYDIPW